MGSGTSKRTKSNTHNEAHKQQQPQLVQANAPMVPCAIQPANAPMVPCAIQPANAPILPGPVQPSNTPMVPGPNEQTKTAMLPGSMHLLELKQLKKSLVDEPQYDMYTLYPSSIDINDLLGIVNRNILMCNNKRAPPEGDPNLVACIPPGVDISNLRSWYQTWVSFSVGVPGYFTPFPPSLGGEYVSLADMNTIFRESLRTSLYSGESSLITSVGTEGAWTLIQLNLYGADRTTEEQNIVIKNRQKRTDLADRKKMLIKRKQLKQYFMDKYEMTEDQLQEWEYWAENMQDSWRKFKDVCEKSEYPNNMPTSSHIGVDYANVCGFLMI